MTNDSNDTLPILIDVKALKKHMQIGNTKAYALVNRKDFPAFRVGKQWKINKQDFID